MSVAKFREAESRESYGVVDGGHTILSCANCKRKLVDILVTRPHEASVWNVVAKCCFCGDRSRYTEIKGGFAYLHIEGSTQVLDADFDGDKVVFTTGEAKPC